MTPLPNAIRISDDTAYEIEFSFCTLVTDATQYQEMMQSFLDAGFDETNSEFLYIDNREANTGDGFTGLNRALNQARGKYAVLCHQDVRAFDGPVRLNQVIAELDALDSSWAVCGNAGLNDKQNSFFYLNEQSHVFESKERQSARSVVTLDENFLVLRQDARLGFSNDLRGFHLYGTDLVVQAALRGLNAYVADFRVEHFGKGKIDSKFYESFDMFEEKYARAFAPRSIRTTCEAVDVGQANGPAKQHREKMRVRGLHWVRPSKKLKKKIRTKLSKNTLEIEGVMFRHPADVPYVAYDALRKGYYEQPERNLIRRFMPPDLPVVELGGSYGIVSGLVNKHLNPDLPQIVVEANPVLLDLCRENALVTGPERDFRLRNIAIDYSGAKEISFVVTDGTHDSHVSSDWQKSGDNGREITVTAMTLSDLLAEEGLSTDYTLICDIEGAEFDLIAKDPDGLAKCQSMIVELHPSVFYDRGESTRRFVQNLERIGFEVQACEATVIAAQRRAP